jgi:hypothetical protein
MALSKGQIQGRNHYQFKFEVGFVFCEFLQIRIHC